MKKYLFTARGFIGPRMYEPGQYGYADDDVIPGAHMVLQEDALVEVELPSAPPAEPAEPAEPTANADAPAGDAPAAE